MNTYSSLQFSKSCLLIIFLCIGAISGVVCGGASDRHEDLVVTATSTVDYKTETEEQGHQKTATTVVISRDPNRETPVSVPTNKPEISDESKAQISMLSRWYMSEADTINWINEIYDGLPDELKSTLRQDGFDRTTFQSVIFSLMGEDIPDVDQASILFRSVGALPVDFLPFQFWDLVLSLSTQSVATESTVLDPKDITSYSTGSSYPTGDEVAEIMMALSQITWEGGSQTTDDIALPTSEEIEGFFSSLPSDVKARIESDGWTEERVNQIADSSEPLNLLEVRSLLALLGDVPITFLQDETIGLLVQLPGFLTVKIADGLGQTAYNELKSGVRPPTGTEFVVLIDSLEAIGLPGR